jgi:hypothetical protein
MLKKPPNSVTRVAQSDSDKIHRCRIIGMPKKLELTNAPREPLQQT